MASDRFQLDYELSDYGKLRFEYDDSLSELEMSQQKRKAMLRSPAFYVVIALLFLLVVWFIASFISGTIKNGFANTVASHLSGLFMLFIISFILILSFTGSWGRFARWASKSKSTSLKQFNSQEEEIDNLRELRKNAIQIYDDYFVVTNAGSVRVFDLHQLKQVRLDSADSKTKNFIVTFQSLYGDVVVAKALIPNDKLTLASLKTIFGDKLLVKIPPKVAICQRNKPIGTLVGMTFFVLIFIAAGIGVICMHYYFDTSIPVFLGAFFIIGGIMGLCGVYDFVPILKDILLPLLMASVFLFFPISLAKSIYDSKNIELSLKNFLGEFNVFSLAVVFFGFIAILGICVTVKNIIDYIRYRKK